jgi:TPR repeat protein
MTKTRAFSVFSAGRLRRCLAGFSLAIGLLAFAPVLAQPAAPAPAQPPAPLPADLQAALKQADAGVPVDLLKLADSGRSDAQYYAAVMLISGRGGIARNPALGCAYAEKASAARADAMYMTGECHQTGAAGAVDLAKAKAAYTRAGEMGFAKSKCALGELLLAEPAEAQRGLALCIEAATAGDVDAQLKTAKIYYEGRGVKADKPEARLWFEKAAAQNNGEAARRLGDMYAAGEGGKRDTKKALASWQAAEKAGDAMAPILVADQLFSNLTGGKKPAPGKYAFKGGIPTADLDIVEQWYQQALQRDPRPEVRARAQEGLDVVKYLKAAGAVAVKKTGS